MREVDKQVSKGLFCSNFHCSIKTSMFSMRNMNGGIEQCLSLSFYGLVYLFTQQNFLNVYNVPSIILEARNIALNRTKSLFSSNSYSTQER